MAVVALGFTLCVLVAVVRADKTDITVVTDAGTFTGYQQDVTLDGDAVSVARFLGIPYAEPPLGQLRFEKSVPKAKLAEPLVTKAYGPECIQMEFFPVTSEPSEDCLYLNVYVPDVAPAAAGPLAVMVWLHGGAFVMGSANIYSGDTLAGYGGVVVVTVNYRLAVLGFLNVGGPASPGNYGLWDQHLALAWVQRNIRAFGGDPDRVTIFGESAGAASTVYQGLYPGNKGLFQRIIAQSGTASAPWASTKAYKDEAKEVAALVGCPTSTDKDIVDCLRNTEADVIKSTLNDFTNGLMRIPFPLGPSADGDFVKVSPDEFFSPGNGAAKEAVESLATFDVLIGMNEAEGAGYINPFVGIDADPDTFLPNRSYFEDVLVPIALKPFLGENLPRVLTELTLAEYTDWSDPHDPLALREGYVSLQGDVNFLAPLYATTSAHARLSDRGLYVYRFSVEPSSSPVHAPAWVTRANHGDELQFVFGGAIDFSSWGSQVTLTPAEWQVSKRIMTAWTNFAKTGDPNKPRDLGVDWKPYTNDNPRYLDINSELGPASVKEHLDEKRAHFLSQLLPAVNRALRQGPGNSYTDTCDKEGQCTPDID